jgi:hypothetical protein
MPIHDWTRVDAGIFHHFHHGWIGDLSRALNRGLVPPDHYALAEQIAGGVAPGLLALQPRLRDEPDLYAEKANSIAIRHIICRRCHCSSRRKFMFLSRWKQRISPLGRPCQRTGAMR